MCDTFTVLRFWNRVEKTAEASNGGRPVKVIDPGNAGNPGKMAGAGKSVRPGEKAGDVAGQKRWCDLLLVVVQHR